MKLYMCYDIHAQTSTQNQTGTTGGSLLPVPCPNRRNPHLSRGGDFSLFPEQCLQNEGGLHLEKNTQLQPIPETGQPKRKKFRLPVAKTVFFAFLALVGGVMFAQPALAAETITVWDKASEIMKDVYDQILLISTIAAIVTASVALLMMNFSRSGKTVDESRAWLKRIIITWAVLNGLGFIMAYITPFFAGGKWTG